MSKSSKVKAELSTAEKIAHDKLERPESLRTGTRSWRVHHVQGHHAQLSTDHGRLGTVQILGKFILYSSGPMPPSLGALMTDHRALLGVSFSAR